MKSKPQYKLITSIDQLSLASFIECIVDQKFDSLIISGDPPQPEILEAWANIYSEYLDLLGDSESHYIIDLQRQAELLNYKITVTEGIIKVLEFLHVQKLVDTLKQFRFDTKHLVQDHHGYRNNLSRITSRLASMKLKLQGMVNEVADYYKDKTTENITREFFHRQLARLSKFQGYHLKIKKLMVTEYVAILKDYLSQSKIVNDGKERENQ